ncbi:hypothetical protein [Paenarthrobacter sp. YIM B13468]|uniref:hypothetical protein n=1 Tax=Paenarthrobacter sp. YIM B13468 TaxID=3366295 RepID=UPI00366D237B
MTLESAKVATSAATAPYTGATIWYYTGTAGGLLNPASTSYNPNAWNGCGTDTPLADGWTTTPPANLSTVTS